MPPTRGTVLTLHKCRKFGRRKFHPKEIDSRNSNDLFFSYISHHWQSDQEAEETNTTDENGTSRRTRLELFWVEIGNHGGKTVHADVTRFAFFETGNYRGSLLLTG